eukprot:GFUD01016778.1.p1 GENE.GFUD01016778.1~~GFUD01016778.1.p1  ORF type:complete len:410 (-),score=78.78 GFUD01016778.1:78-1307(-)
MVAFNEFVFYCRQFVVGHPVLRSVLGHPVLSASAVASCGIYVYYSAYVVQRPTLHCQQGTVFHNMLDRLAIIKEEYRPTFWCWEPRLQTILASVVRNTLPDIDYTREVFTFKDGGQVGLDWMREGEGDPAKPIVLILPGLTGSSQSEYVKTFVNVARDEVGARCVVFNFRGRGGLALKSPRTYCAANSDDLSEIVDHIKKEYPLAPVLAVGISLGGIILGNYLTDQQEAARSKLLAAMLVSVCYDTFEGCKSLEKPGLNLLLNRHLASCLVESIKEVKQLFESTDTWDLDLVFSSRTIREFDDRFTARMFGYGSVSEYYAAARLYGKIRDIKVATLALNAEDDPFQPADSIPYQGAEKSTHVAILTTKYGGHIGFMEGSIPSGHFYSDRVFSQYLQAVFSNKDMIEQYV